MPTPSCQLILGPVQTTDMVTRANTSGKIFYRIVVTYDSTSGMASAYPVDNKMNEITDSTGNSMRIPGCPYPPDCGNVHVAATTEEKEIALQKCIHTLEVLAEQMNLM